MTSMKLGLGAASGTVPRVFQSGPGGRALFRVVRTRLPRWAARVVYGRARVAVRRDHHLYMTRADRSNAGRSMHSVSLVSQMVGVQKIRKDLPTTQTVISVD